MQILSSVAHMQPYFRALFIFCIGFSMFHGVGNPPYIRGGGFLCHGVGNPPSKHVLGVHMNIPDVPHPMTPMIACQRSWGHFHGGSPLHATL